MRNISVSTVTRLRARRTGFDSQQVQALYLLVTASRPALGSTLFNGYQTLFPCKVKRPGRDTDQSSQSSADIKNV
jgi:hypothetical protein